MLSNASTCFGKSGLFGPYHAANHRYLQRASEAAFYPKTAWIASSPRRPFGGAPGRPRRLGPSPKDTANTWFTPYYFSIVSYTTLGFGDVRPATLAGEIIVSSEVILGYTTLGLLLSVLAQSIARRS